MKILILGGYGVFGGRLAGLLADVPGIELLICGRRLDAASAFCAGYVGKPAVRALQVDRDRIEPVLAAERPDLLVDASGPFQEYGERPYRVIEACIAARIPYLDFADGADFVFGVARFDAQARAAGVYVLSGVSSFPVLTAAVVRRMARDMDIVTVEGGIAPSPHAGIGLNVMRAVVGYAGAPVKLRRNGAPGHGLGLAESRRFTVAVPGRVPLRNLHFSLVDVPDLQVLPLEYPGMTDIWIGAAPIPEALHRLLNLLVKARARFGLPSLAPLSRLFYTVLNLMKFGEHRGGMYVRATGTHAGREMVQSWHLLAEGDGGPYIPSMAVEAVVRKLLVGERPHDGARPATHALELADYERLFDGRSIFTGFRRDDPDASLYPDLLGTAFATLPGQVQALHAAAHARQWRGVAEVRRGTGLLSRLVGGVFGFPPPVRTWRSAWPSRRSAVASAGPATSPANGFPRGSGAGRAETHGCWWSASASSMSRWRWWWRRTACTWWRGAGHAWAFRCRPRCSPLDAPSRPNATVASCSTWKSPRRWSA